NALRALFTEQDWPKAEVGCSLVKGRSWFLGQGLCAAGADQVALHREEPGGLVGRLDAVGVPARPEQDLREREVRRAVQVQLVGGRRPLARLAGEALGRR